MSAISKIFDIIVNAMCQFIDMVKGMVKTIVTYVVSFKNHIVNYFKNQLLEKGIHIPFIVRGDDFQTMLKNAPRKNLSIFAGVYDEVIDEISNLQFIAADQLDIQTQQVLGNEQIVVLE